MRDRERSGNNFLLRFTIVIFFFVILFYGYREALSADPPYLDSIVITPQNPTMSVGETLTFTAQGYDQYGDPFPISDPHWEGDGIYGTITPNP